MLDPPDRIHAVAASSEGIAVVVGDRTELHLYAPGSTESRVIPAELGGGDMVLGFESFWIYHPDGRLLRVEPASGGIQAEVEMEADLYFPGIAVGDGAVWLTSWDLEAVLRVDARTHELTDRIALDGAAEHLAVHDGVLWLTLPQDDAVIRVDPMSGQETARIAVEFPSRVISVP